MGISLLHAGLAAGAALAALPVILHLFMRQTPKHIVFPALRLIRQRQKKSRKRLRIKNWLLLLARAALIALMALALARPSLVTQATLGAEEVPTALGLVFDTSLSMGYRERPDKNLLDLAKERALEILKKLPDTSQVFVVDSADPGVPVALSPAAARKQIDGLALRAANRPLNAAVGQAYEGVAGSDRPRHEVYVLTDLARSSWNPSQPVEGLERIKKVKSGVSTFVLRLTPKGPHDVAVVAAEPSTSVAIRGEPVEVRAKLRSLGPATKRVAEFYLDDFKKDQKSVVLPANGEVEVRFQAPRLDPAIALHQGEVRVAGAPDPLAFDDIRYFSFTVEPAKRVLIVSDRTIDSDFVAFALDPDLSLSPGTPRTCQVERSTPAAFAKLTADALMVYTGIFLLNVREPGGSAWESLNAYVRQGGGLVIGLGDLTRPESYNTGAAAGLLPATLVKPVKPSPRTTFGKVADFTHPLFLAYRQQLDTLLSAVPVFQHWAVKPSEGPGTRTLLSYVDGAPALIERTFRGPRTGRVLLWTTPLSRRTDTQSNAAWNEFPLADWPFFHLMNQTVPYLAGSTADRRNYEAGEEVGLPNDPSRRFTNYSVLGPESKTPYRLSPPNGNEPLVVPAPQFIGQWKVTASGSDGKTATLGFSVNPPVQETESLPLETAQLNMLFGGKDGYKLADSPESLASIVKIAQVGREIFPWIMVLILMVVTAEGLLANRFYRESAPRSAVGVPSAAS